MSGPSRRKSLLHPSSWEDTTPSSPKVRKSLLDPAAWVDDVTDIPAQRTAVIPVVVIPVVDTRQCQGCKVSLSDRRKGTLWCQPKCRDLSMKYGIGVVEFAAMMTAQGGKCAICKQVQRRSALAVDHDHRTGFVRGLLCLKCNSELLPAGRHSAVRLTAAAEYLTTPPAFAVIGYRKATP